MSGIIPYKSYVFKDKDPIIDVTRTIVQDSGFTWAEIEAKSGVSRSTLNGWFNGNTRRPQFATTNSVLRTCGYNLQPVRFTPNGNNRRK